uniref:PSP proline-rich domain-containing protein n=1 Tax=Oncorhynchus tshawytscha TaxID=74940 RepID=A0A8C8BZP6_ONCTS
REEMLDRLKGYMMQVSCMCVCVHESPMPPMPMPPMPPGMGMLQAMSMMAGGPPPPGMRMGMEPPGMPPGLSQEDQLKMVQQRAAMMMQHEERAKQQVRSWPAFSKPLGAAVMLEHERQQELAKRQHGGPGPRMSDPGSRPPGMMPPMMREDVGVGPKIPQALEKILQLKEIRQEQLGATPTALVSVIRIFILPLSFSPSQKNRKRRNRKKKNKKRREQEKREHAEEKKEEDGEKEKEPEVEIEYITEEPEIYDPNFIFFKRIFEAFKLTDDVKKEKEKEPEKEPAPALMRKKGFEEEKKDSDDSDDEIRPDVPKMSKKKLRRMNRLTVAELKQLVARPDVVEMHDVTAQEPKLLVHLKATRNTVPVPRHWCFKRKYLQGKRGIEKPPFELPEFIKRTGIQEMREALQEKEDAKTMKTKMREKVRPKMGKIDIDYQKLHDAFFKWQMKPKLSIHGDLYYEGKEFETRLKEKKPGDLSDELRIALGMPVGPNSHKVPPPWLIAMQRYGPPPSYPNLKIPGLNSPIPESCSFGYHAGGWGKPPVDETGKPLYGDVFGTNAVDFQAKAEEEEVDRTPWGELEPSDEESSEEEEEDESDEEKPDETGFFTPADSGLITPGGFSSVPAGMETPELIELRKKKIEEAMDGNETPQLFTVLPERRTGSGGAAMMASTHIYDVSGAMAGRKAGGGQEFQGVEVALAPEELELDPMAMTQKYEEHVRNQEAQVEKEDFSDMVAEHAAKQKVTLRHCNCSGHLLQYKTYSYGAKQFGYNVH